MRPRIGITMGDPAGIGPEITVKMFAKQDLHSICVPVVIGAREVLADAINIVNINDLVVNPIVEPAEAKDSERVINIIDLNNICRADFQYGKINEKAGRASGEFIQRAVKLALDKKIDAIVTNPIHKESFELGGWGKKYAGHTEMLADLTGTKDYTMMLAHENLRVVHVSTHVSLRQALDLVKKERIKKVARIACDGCHALGIKNPKIAIAGLNPHSGEGGLFGDEEIKEIFPAVKELKTEGLDVVGPVPPDTVFGKALGGIFDVVVTMYHDQGHIPTKTVGFKWDRSINSWGEMRGVNITLGLPIIRTSVDHGTAFGKAGKGKADYTSLYDALQYAITMAKNRESK